MTSVHNVNLIPLKSVNFKADNRNRAQISYIDGTPMDSWEREIQKQKKEQKKQKFKQNVSYGLGIAASCVMLAYFGTLLKDRANAKKIEKLIENTAKELASNESTARKVEDAKKFVEFLNNGDIQNAIASCPNKILKIAAANEYSKGFAASNQKVKNILSLAVLDESKSKEIDLFKAIELMNKKIVGMDEVKEQILDYLIQQNYCIRNGIKNTKPLVLCLDGPAGVGKTTISEVLSEALGMHYKKISLAGATGKAPIRGSESVYTGAEMGGIASGQIEGGTKRVLYCIDEVEKGGTSDHNGNIEHTLLALFDDQAKFTDDFLDVPIDISQSVFVLTSNDFNKLSKPLQNRVIKININPYDNKTKASIAKLKMEQALSKYKLDDTKVRIVSDDVYDHIAKMTKDDGGREATRLVDTLIKKLIGIIELGENKGKVVEVNSTFVENQLASLKDKTSIQERINKSKNLNRH